MSRGQLVFIVSPFRPLKDHYTQEESIAYARAAWLHSWSLIEVPYVGHLYMTTFLDDTDERERARGMAANYLFMRRCELIAVYTNLGISGGMAQDIRQSHDFGLPIEERTLKWPTTLTRHNNPSFFPPAVTALLPDASASAAPLGKTSSTPVPRPESASSTRRK